jgi:uncharacterized protein with FMN-binding domain
MKNWLIVFLVVLGILTCIVVAGIIGFSVVTQNLNNLVNVEIQDVDLDSVPDGTYSGNYETFPIIVNVEVTVTSGVITAIEIVKHQSGQGAPAEIIVDDVLTEQTLQVDSIAGATYSSRVILLAISDALTNQVPA